MSVLTARQREDFARDGFLKMEGVCLSGLEGYRRAVDEHVSSDPLTVFRFGQSGERIHCKIPQLAERDEVFLGLARHPLLVDAVEELIGPALIFRDVVVAKPPRTGTAIHYHQDAAYWDVRPPERVLSAWIALDDSPEEAGCLRVLPGSQNALMPHGLAMAGKPIPDLVSRALRGAVSLTGTGDNPKSSAGRALRSLKKLILGNATKVFPGLSDLNDLHIDPERIPQDRLVSLPVKAGDGILFPSRLIHGSGPNTSSSPRRAYIATYMALECAPAGEASRFLRARAA
jgi:ectoine hydroxylase-related dioxygenase (phytanoyl-CoA dioxygenase family)